MPTSSWTPSLRKRSRAAEFKWQTEPAKNRRSYIFCIRICVAKYFHFISLAGFSLCNLFSMNCFPALYGLALRLQLPTLTMTSAFCDKLSWQQIRYFYRCFRIFFQLGVWKFCQRLGNEASFFPELCLVFS